MSSQKKKLKISVYVEKELYDLIKQYAKKERRTLYEQFVMFAQEGVGIRMFKDAAAEKAVAAIMGGGSNANGNEEENSNE